MKSFKMAAEMSFHEKVKCLVVSKRIRMKFGGDGPLELGAAIARPLGLGIGIGIVPSCGAI